MENVLHILTLLRRAGLEVMFLNFLRHMKAKNPEWLDSQYVFAVGLSSYFRDELNKLGVTVFSAHKKYRYDISIINQVNKIIKDNNINILYGQNFIGNMIGGLVKLQNPNVRLICHEHGTSWNVKGIKTALTKIWILKSNQIICNSNAAKILLMQRFRASDDKLKVILNGVPKPKKINVQKDKNRILFVGRLEPVKSPETLIYMMKDLEGKGLNVQLDILGDGTLFDKLIYLSKQLKVERKITFHGNVENVSEYMARSSLLILPSIREALGNVIIEAAYQKTPTIGTNVDGIPEVIRQNETGLLLNPTEPINENLPVKYVVNPEYKTLTKPKRLSPKLLAQKVEELLNNRERLEEMGENAYNHVINNFSMDHYYDNIVKLFMDGNKK